MKKIEKVEEKIENLGKKILDQIRKKTNPSLEIPIRSLSNIKFDPSTKRLVLGENKANRYLLNMAHIRKFVQTISIASLSKELIEIGKTISLREAFYILKKTLPNSKINLVDEQEESNECIEDLELLTNELRERLHFNANKLGSAAGKIVIEDKGDVIDLTKLGSGGWSIPSNVENIQFKKVKAKFVIYLEKAAEWERLHEDRVWEKLDCLIVSSQGQATRGVRRLLQRLNVEYNLPIYALVDFDPWGIYIYSVLKYGSITLAHISDKLALPEIKFLGLTADDIEKYDLKKHLIKFKDIDFSRLNQVMNYEWFKNNKTWQRQFKIMKEWQAKAELEALSSRGITFISDKYIPEKIKNQDFLD